MIYPVTIGWRAFFHDYGISVQQFLKLAQLPEDLLSRTPLTISEQEYFKFWYGLDQLLNDDPSFLVQLIENLNLDNLSPPLFAMLYCKNLNMALEWIKHYKPLMGPLNIDIQQQHLSTSFQFYLFDNDTKVPQSLSIFILAFLVKLARLGTREEISPISIQIATQLPPIERLENFLLVNITQGAINEIVFSAEDAQKPFLTFNQVMLSIFKSELQKQLDDLKQDLSFRKRVRACLVEIITSGQISISDVAAKLALSNRTIQRRLQAEDTTFQNELDALRKDLAYYYLRYSDYTNAHIAFLLGYQEIASFYRAFRVWTGQTPEAFRSGGENE